jgi:hypothetical protein
MKHLLIVLGIFSLIAFVHAHHRSRAEAEARFWGDA